MDSGELTLLKSLNDKTDKICVAIFGDSNGARGLKADVADIKDTLGGDQYGNPGLVSRILKAEKEMGRLKYVYTLIVLGCVFVFDSLKDYVIDLFKRN